MPWRYAAHETPDPYAIWLSEMMLQQTTVTTVRDYFTRFRERWPRIDDLAAATLDDVLHAWQGLGYYNRAHNLYKCAQIIVKEYGGKFPKTAEELIKLPGIGPYASASIAAIAFNQPALVIDGNVERVLSRLYRLNFPPKRDRDILLEKLDQLKDAKRHGDFAQSMMELGSEICKPKKPDCTNCPVNSYCAAFAQGDVLSFPLREPKKKRPQKYATAYIITNDRDEILLRKRPNKGLLKGLVEVPTSDWSLTPEKIKSPGLLDKTVRHVFTHFDLDVQIVKLHDNTPSHLQHGAFFVNKNDLQHQALPTLVKKILRAGMKSA